MKVLRIGASNFVAVVCGVTRHGSSPTLALAAAVVAAMSRRSFRAAPRAMEARPS